MTTISTNQLKGNYAQSIAAAWLSRMCLVRSVSEGTDIGIDLYCESVIEGSPYLHFWVQVKAINRKNLKLDGINQIASYRFKTKHLKYWARQPIPVYAFLVPVIDWPPSPPQKIFGIKISEQIARNGIPSTATVEYETFECFEANTLDSDLQKFITEIVPWDTAALWLEKGVVIPIPSYNEDSKKKFTLGIGYQHLEKILENIRDSSVQGLFHSMMLERKQGLEWLFLRKKFEAIALSFQDNLDDFGLSMLVRAAHIDGDIGRAKQYIISAIERIRNDQITDNEKKEMHIQKISTLLKDFE